MFSIQKLSTDKLRFNTIFTGAVDLFIAMWLLVDIEFVANIPYLQNMEYIKFAKSPYARTIFLLWAISSALLIVGAVKRIIVLLLPWLIYKGFVIGLALLSMFVLIWLLWTGIYEKPLATPILLFKFLISLGITLYGVWTYSLIYKYFLDLKQQNGNKIVSDLQRQNVMEYLRLHSSRNESEV